MAVIDLEFDAPAFHVRQVPVEHVHLHQAQLLNDGLHSLHREEMTDTVQHQPTVLLLGAIHNGAAVPLAQVPCYPIYCHT